MNRLEYSVGWEGELKDFCPKKILLSQASKPTAGNLGGFFKPPDEIKGVEFQENVEINVS